MADSAGRMASASKAHGRAASNTARAPGEHLREINEDLRGIASHWVCVFWMSFFLVGRFVGTILGGHVEKF